jgi:glycosyltransferase involved in cell wall biosynthesis
VTTEQTEPGPGAAGADLAARSLLAVSIAYPPSALPRAVQVARLLKHLKTRTTLVCADYDHRDRNDPTLAREAEAPLADCLRVPFERTAWRKLLGRAAGRLHLPVVDKLPDSFSPWQPRALAAFERFARARDYTPDVLATFGSPMSDHLFGLALKRRLRVPWVAHFSDPWVDNPFLDHDRLSRRLNRALEGRVLRAADRLVFTSAETVELVTSKHPPGLKAKARVVPHAFEPDSFPAPAGRDGPGLVVRYVGEFYGRRTPAPLFEALRRLLASEPAALAGVRFELVGSVGAGPLAEAGLGALPPGLVSARPTVKYLDSLRLMSGSDGLLVIDAPADVSVFLPSKLIDYVGAGRPIFGITPRGAAAALIRRLGGWVADPSDPAATASALKEFIAFLRGRAGSNGPWGDAGVRGSFEAEAVAERFAGILREVLA